jgi:putative transposase
MCQVLGVSRSGYYAWRTRPTSRRELFNRQLLAEIQRIHQSDCIVYGSPRVCKELVARGFQCGENRVARIMRTHKIRAQQGKRLRRPALKTSSVWIAPNVLAGQFQTEEANQVWVADITYVNTKKGWLYLAVVMDLYSRRIIGWSMSSRITSQVSLDALHMALLKRNPKPDTLLHHSDRGIHYANKSYQQLLMRRGINSSMSRRGVCHDNAVMESFFHSLKVERVLSQNYQSQREAQRDLFEYIEIFYNQNRRHSSLGYVSPAEYEQTLPKESLISVST